MSSRRRILVVDDDARLAASLRRALAYEGHAVEVAADGPGALIAARDRPPDLVVLCSGSSRTPPTSCEHRCRRYGRMRNFLRERADAAADDRSAALADIVSEAERMSGLVDGLLVLARADAGVAVERRPVDLRAVATEEARRFRPPGRARDETPGVQVTATGSALDERTLHDDVHHASANRDGCFKSDLKSVAYRGFTDDLPSAWTSQ